MYHYHRDMTRSSYIAKLRDLLTQVDHRINTFDPKEPGAGYRAFCWAYEMRYELFFAEKQPRRLHAIVRDVMFDWDKALKSEIDFENQRDKLKLGSAMDLLHTISQALKWDIPDFVEDMRAEAREYTNTLNKYHPSFQTVVVPETEKGISEDVAKQMMAEMDAEMENVIVETDRLNDIRMRAGFGRAAVYRLAELRLFFDNEEK